MLEQSISDLATAISRLAETLAETRGGLNTVPPAPAKRSRKPKREKEDSQAEEWKQAEESKPEPAPAPEEDLLDGLDEPEAKPTSALTFEEVKTELRRFCKAKSPEEGARLLQSHGIGSVKALGNMPEKFIAVTEDIRGQIGI